MMYFDFPSFIRYNFRAFFKTRGQHYRLTPKRLLVLLIWLSLFIPAQIINRICFLLDEILFPNYRGQQIRTPVFIIGNPRSGTTFLHRLLYKDSQTFTSFTVWEMLFAPSIVQRKIIWALIRAGKGIGSPFRWIARLINQRLSHGKRNSAHAIKLNAAEEDEHILIHNWTSESLWAIYPFKDELMPYFFFDRDLPKEKQRQAMNFYKRMIQKHLYAHGGDKILLSKNPSHSAKLAALTETFPQARFVNLIRTPFEAMPSMLDYMSTGWNFFCDPLEPFPFKDEVIDVMKYYYLYPATFFEEQKERCNFIKYEDFVQQPDEFVEDLYAWLELDYSEAFGETVTRETNAARRYRSQHKYSIEKMGLSEERIAREFAEVFYYYEFDNHRLEFQDPASYWKFKRRPKAWKAQLIKRKKMHKIKHLGEKGKLTTESGGT